MGGWTGNDVMFGGTGSDLMVGYDGNDTIIGDEDNDFLYGELGNDQLYGGNGNDQLNGGAQLIPAAFSDDDILNGGAGSDEFQFSIVLGDDDVIQDMISGQDRIVLMDTGGVVTNLAQLQALAAGLYGQFREWLEPDPGEHNVGRAAFGDVLFVV